MQPGTHVGILDRPDRLGRNEASGEQRGTCRQPVAELARQQLQELAAEGTVNHVGVQVDAVNTVMAHLARVKAAGIPVIEEMGVDCCHANQDKFWVRDPDGVDWEVYHLNYDLEGEEDTAKPKRAALPLAKGNACCAS